MTRLSDCLYHSLITPQLYLSDKWTAEDDAKLKDLGITHVVSVLDGGAPDLPQWISSNRRLYIDIRDAYYADIFKHLEITTAFITAAISEDTKNKVLVHCIAGVSRSPIVVCAYLVATTEMTASETLSHVQSLRKVVSPIIPFREQLERYGTRFVKPVESKTLQPDSESEPLV